MPALSPSRDFLTSLLYSAIAAQMGLLLNCSDPELARQRLYSARNRAADPSLAELQFRRWDSPEGNLIIVKSNLQIGSGPQPEQSA